MSTAEDNNWPPLFIITASALSSALSFTDYFNVTIRILFLSTFCRSILWRVQPGFTSNEHRATNDKSSSASKTAESQDLPKWVWYILLELLSANLIWMAGNSARESYQLGGAENNVQTLVSSIGAGVGVVFFSLGIYHGIFMRD